MISASSLIFWGLTQFSPSETATLHWGKTDLGALGRLFTFKVESNVWPSLYSGQILSIWVNQLGFTFKWGVFSTAATNTVEFRSSGRGCSALPVGSCSVQANSVSPQRCSGESRPWWWGVVGCISKAGAASCPPLRVTLHLSSAVWRLRGAKQHLPRLTVCTVLREHSVVPVPPAGQKTLLSWSSGWCDREMGEEQDVTAGLGWRSWRGSAVQQTRKKSLARSDSSLLQSTEHL